MTSLLVIIGVARGGEGAMSFKFLAYLVILCFREVVSQNQIVKIFSPSQNLGLVRNCLWLITLVILVALICHCGNNLIRLYSFWRSSRWCHCNVLVAAAICQFVRCPMFEYWYQTPKFRLFGACMTRLNWDIFLSLSLVAFMFRCSKLVVQM